MLWNALLMALLTHNKNPGRGDYSADFLKERWFLYCSGAGRGIEEKSMRIKSENLGLNQGSVIY